MSTAVFNQWKNTDGTENYKCRVWVNFNGTGTVAIRASGNVSSITDYGPGKYGVRFSSPLPPDYAAVVMSGSPQTIDTLQSFAAYSPTTTECSFQCRDYSTAVVDPTHVHVAIFR